MHGNDGCYSPPSFVSSDDDDSPNEPSRIVSSSPFLSTTILSFVPTSSIFSSVPTATSTPTVDGTGGDGEANEGGGTTEGNDDDDGSAAIVAGDIHADGTAAVADDGGGAEVCVAFAYAATSPPTPG